MPDLDDLLRSDIADAASRSVQPPEFAALAARGRRMRHHRRVATAGALVLVVLAGGGVAFGRDTLGTTPRPADPRPTPHRVHRTSAPDHGRTPEQVVDDPAASVTQVAVAAEDPDVRAVLWQVCLRRCNHREAAIALTTDGFASRTLVRVGKGAYPDLAPAGSRAFLVTNDGRHPYLLGTDGAKHPIATPGPAAPVRDGEVVTWWGNEVHVAVDPASGTAHLVNAPPGVGELMNEGAGRLVGLGEGSSAAAPSVHWSDDRGATWRGHQLVAAGRFLYQLVPSAAPGTTAVLAGSDGATLFPFQAVERGTRDGASWRSFPQDNPPSAFVDGGAVLPDGRLLVTLELAKAPFHKGTGSEPRRGLFVSDGADWGRFHRLTPPVDSSAMAPQDARQLAGADLELQGLSVSPGQVTAYVSELSGNRVFAVTDGGRTWTEVRSR